MNVKNAILRISRDKYIEENRSVAIARLNQFHHLPGQPVMVAYYDENNREQTVLAIGIKNGLGPDCYRISELGETLVVKDVCEDLPDVSQLTNSEVYISKGDTGVWNYVYLSGNTRKITPISGGPFIFKSILSGFRWFYYPSGKCKREDSFFDESEIRDISGLQVYVQPDEPEDKEGVIWIDTSDQELSESDPKTSPVIGEIKSAIQTLKDLVYKHEFAFSTVISTGGFSNNVRNSLSTGTKFIRGFMTEDKDSGSKDIFYYDKFERKVYSVLETKVDDLNTTKVYTELTLRNNDTFFDISDRKFYYFNTLAFIETPIEKRQNIIDKNTYRSYEWDGQKMILLVDYSDDPDTVELIKQGKNLDTTETTGPAEYSTDVTSSPDYYLCVKYSESSSGTSPQETPGNSWKKVFIGLSRNSTPESSAVPDDYTWSEITSIPKGFEVKGDKSGYTWIKYANKSENKIYSQYKSGETDLIGISVGRSSGTVEPKKDSDYTWFNISETGEGYPIVLSLYPEWADTGAQYSLPNAKHICIKMGTFAKMKENLDSLLQGELCWCYDNKRLYIISKDPSTGSQIAVWLNSGSGSGSGSSSSSGGQGIDSVALYKLLDKLSTLGFRVDLLGGEVQKIYRVKINPVNGQLQVYDSGLDSISQKPNSETYKTIPMYDRKLYINSVYCGGLTSNEHSYNYCSHNFVELSNVSDSDINLNGLYLQYSDGDSDSQAGVGNWSILPLWGTVKAHSTFLIRGAQCSVLKTNTTKIIVPEPDLEWYDNGSLIKFNDKKAKFYLCYHTGDKDENITLINPFRTTESGLNLPQGFIDLVGFGSTGNSINAYIGAPYNFLNSSRLMIRYYPLDMTSQANKSIDKRKNSTEWYYVDLSKEDGDIIPSIKAFSPASSKSGKTIYFNKSVYTDTKPNLVTCTFGIQATYRDLDYTYSKETQEYSYTTRENPILASRCFNWISKDYYPEYLWWRKIKDESGKSLEESWNEQESFNSGSFSYISSQTTTITYKLTKLSKAPSEYSTVSDIYSFVKSAKEGDSCNYSGSYYTLTSEDVSTSTTNSTTDTTILSIPETTSENHTETPGESEYIVTGIITKTRNPITIKDKFSRGWEYYKRIRSESTDGEPFVTHKVVLSEIFTPGVYEYKVGRKTKSGDLDESYMSDTYSFTVYSDSSLVSGFNIVQTTDQQGFNWDEYQIWKTTAKYINKESKSKDCKFTINTGDMTQNGNRINEWIDYINARNIGIPGKEDMVTIGNNDLCPSNPFLLGNGSDGQKINHINITFYYTFELPEGYWNNTTKTIESEPSTSNTTRFPEFSVQNNNNLFFEIYVPSLYSFNYGFVHFLCVNSEIKDVTESDVWKIRQGSIYIQIQKWLEADIQEAQYNNYPWIFPYMHEVPFTILTKETVDGYVNANREITKNKNRGGSHLNNNTTGEYFWFTKMLEKYGIKIVTGGHKHTYDCTWPLLEGYDGVNKETSFNPVIQVTVDEMINCTNQSSMIYVSNETLGIPSTDMEARKALKNKSLSELDSLFFFTDEKLNRKYPKSPVFTSDDKALKKYLCGGFQLVSDYTKITGVIYYTLQATGYKNTSNKELPYSEVTWDRYFWPCTIKNGAKANTGQYYPFYCIWNFDLTKIIANSRRLQGVESTAGKYNVNDTKKYYSQSLPLTDIGANGGSNESIVSGGNDLIYVYHYHK